MANSKLILILTSHHLAALPFAALANHSEIDCVVTLAAAIRQHGSAVYVGMVVVGCMLYYNRKVLNRSKSRRNKPSMKKEGYTVFRANLISKHKRTVG